LSAEIAIILFFSFSNTEINSTAAKKGGTTTKDSCNH